MKINTAVWILRHCNCLPDDFDNALENADECTIWWCTFYALNRTIKNAQQLQVYIEWAERRPSPEFCEFNDSELPALPEEELEYKSRLFPGRGLSVDERTAQSQLELAVLLIQNGYDFRRET